MEQRAMRTVGILGLVSILGLMTLWLFGLQTVSDPAAGASAGKIYKSLQRSLDESLEMREAVRVTLKPGNKAGDGPRHYTVRIRVSRAVAADQTATRRMIDRAVEIAAANVKGRGDMILTGIGIKPDGAEIQQEYTRVKQGNVFTVVRQDDAK